MRKYRKKRVRLKGKHQWKIVSSLIGKKDAKKNKIIVDEIGTCKSAYIEDRAKNYTCYVAKLKDVTKKIDSESIKAFINLFDTYKECEREIEFLEKELEQLNLNKEKDPTIIRKTNTINYNLNARKSQKQKVYVEMIVLTEKLQDSRHETEQMMLVARTIIGKQITAYLKGAGKYMPVKCFETDYCIERKEADSIYTTYNKFAEEMKTMIQMKGVNMNEPV